MPELPVVSGQSVVEALRKFGYEKAAQKGSHAKMKKFYGATKHIIVVPLHRELDRGTLMSIIRRLRVYIPQEKFLQVLHNI